MTIVKWKTLSSTYVHKSKFLKLRKDERASELGEHSFYILEFPHWANVVAVTHDKQVILVRQFRHGLNDLNLEIPGGIVDPGEDPMDTASRELTEETGYQAGDIKLLSSVSVNPAIQSNWCHLFLATDCKRTKEQDLDGTESIAVETVSIPELSAMVKEGKIHHSLNVLAITLALQELSAP